MASSTLFSVCVAVCLLFSFSTSFSSAPSNEKVKLDLYYQTLCLGCSDFMVNYLPKIFRNGLIDNVDLSLVPYGNARLLDNGTIACQHGEYECKLNMVEACAIHVRPNKITHYRFIYCVGNLVVKNNYTEWESCFNKAGYDPKPITDCLNSPLGKQLILENAKKTASLKPPHQFVPWAVVNGKPLKEHLFEFMSFICDSYNGIPPEACKHISSRALAVEEHQNNQIQLCWNE